MAHAVIRRLLMLLTALALAGCESDQRAELEERRRAAATPTPTPSPTPASADDRRLEGAELTLDDVPEGWRAVEAGSDIAGCQQIVNARTRATGSAASPSLNGERGVFTQSWVFLYADPAIAEQTYVDLVRDDTRACVAETIMQEVSAAETYDARPARPDPLGQANEGGRMTINLSASAAFSQVFLDVRFAQSGRGVAMMLFVAPDQPFDEALRVDLVDALADRFKAALK
jgi:hypothetical protein